MHTSFPLVDTLSASKSPVHFNLGTIGRFEAHHAGESGPPAARCKPFYGALVEANPGLPRPGRNLEAMRLRVPEDMPLLVLAATNHGVAYYVICDLQEQSARAALRAACALGRLEIGFTCDSEPLSWAAMYLSPQIRYSLLESVAACEAHGIRRDESWRDQLGLLLLCLPSLLTEADRDTVQCSHHAAMLLSGSRAHRLSSN